MDLKKITIIALAISYSIFLFVLSSGEIISDFIEIRKDIICHSSKTESLNVSKKFWDSLVEKEEFVYHNNYYDLKKVVIYKQTVKVEVVKDKFEQIMKKFTKNINSKNKKNHSLGVKKIIVGCFLNNSLDNSPFSSNNSKNDFTAISSEKYNYLASIFRPPCIT
jgi:hypothetical protein